MYLLSPLTRNAGDRARGLGTGGDARTPCGPETKGETWNGAALIHARHSSRVAGIIVIIVSSRSRRQNPLSAPKFGNLLSFRGSLLPRLLVGWSNCVSCQWQCGLFWSELFSAQMPRRKTQNVTARNSNEADWFLRLPQKGKSCFQIRTCYRADKPGSHRRRFGRFSGHVNVLRIFCLVNGTHELCLFGCVNSHREDRAVAQRLHFETGVRQGALSKLRHFCVSFLNILAVMSNIRVR